MTSVDVGSLSQIEHGWSTSRDIMCGAHDGQSTGVAHHGWHIPGGAYRMCSASPGITLQHSRGRLCYIVVVDIFVVVVKCSCILLVWMLTRSERNSR